MAKGKQEECCETMPGMAWRVAVSVFVGVCWMIFIILFLFFYAGNYSLYQNLAVFLASILVVAAVLGPMWAYWGIKYARTWDKKHKKK